MDFNTTVQLSNGHCVVMTAERVRALRAEAAQACHDDMVIVCDVALGERAPGGQGPTSRASALHACASVIDEAAGELRDLTDTERANIRANATGEDVYCGDDASALEIARGACDDSDQWSEDAEQEAAAIAREAWQGAGRRWRP